VSVRRSRSGRRSSSTRREALTWTTSQLGRCATRVPSPVRASAAPPSWPPASGSPHRPRGDQRHTLFSKLAQRRALFVDTIAVGGGLGCPEIPPGVTAPGESKAAVGELTSRQAWAEAAARHSRRTGRRRGVRRRRSGLTKRRERTSAHGPRLLACGHPLERSRRSSYVSSMTRRFQTCRTTSATIARTARAIPPIRPKRSITSAAAWPP
jgi:hypothetical protein